MSKYFDMRCENTENTEPDLAKNGKEGQRQSVRVEQSLLGMFTILARIHDIQLFQIIFKNKLMY